MSSSVIFSPTKRVRLRKVCVVGDPSDSDIAVINILKDQYECDVFRSETGKEYYNDDDMVFFLSKFESFQFEDLVSSINGNPKKIIGPAVIRSRSEAHADLFAPRPSRPLYCEIMKDISIVMGGDIKDKRKYVDSVHFMGGHARKEPNAKTNVLITTQAKGKIFRQLVTLGQYVLLPSWVSDCWEHRDDIHFDVLSEHMVNKHRIGVFESLIIYFHGFTETDRKDMKKCVEENKGRVVDDPSSATHVVFYPAAKDLDKLACYHNQRHVTNEWLWTSVHLQHCANEDSYALPGRSLRKRQTTASPQAKISRSSILEMESSHHSALNATPDYLYSTDDLEKAVQSPKRLDKKHQVCMEMLDTENNYLNALGLLTKFRMLLEEELAAGNENLLNKSEMAVIFGKVQPIIDVHETIAKKIRDLVHNWKPSNDVSKVWIDAEKDLNRVYPPYINTYENAKKALEEADLSNSKFHAFLKAKESNPDFKRNTLKELLIRPVQRLPSVTLLLKEVQKRSDKSCMKSIEEALEVVGGVLSRANNMRQLNDDHIAHLTLFNDVDRVPAYLVCSKRTFIRDVLAYSICGTSGWSRIDKKNVRLMLFNDVILVCMIREEEAKKGTLSRLTRQASLASLRMEPKKPYKFVDKIPVHHIREWNKLKLDDDETTECDNQNMKPIQSDDPPIYAWTIREVTGDNMWVLQPKNEISFLDFLTDVQEKLFTDHGRDITGPGFTLDHCLHPELGDSVAKFLKKQSFGNTAVYQGTLPRQTGFRRTVSQVSLSINRFANGLGRMTASRSNLRNISENSPIVSMSPRPSEDDNHNGSVNTPKRGLRSRLTSSTFVNRALLRRNSVRGGQDIAREDNNKENQTAGY